MKCFICGYVNTEADHCFVNMVKKKVVWPNRRKNEDPELLTMMSWTYCRRCQAILRLTINEAPGVRDCVDCPMVFYKNTDSGTDLVCHLSDYCFFVEPLEAVREWHGLLSGNQKLFVI